MNPPALPPLSALSLRSQCLLALVAGALSVFAYAPFDLFPLAALCFAVLWAMWQQVSPRRVLGLGFLWGFGHFWAGGGWLFVAFHVYGGLNPPLTVFFLSIFFAYLALWGTLAGWLFVRLRASVADSPVRAAALGAACWTLGEWMRGWMFTGVPWLAIGYTQTPPSPLAGFAPLFGSYGASFLLVFVTALVFAACHAQHLPAVRLRAALLAFSVLSGGAVLRLMPWTAPVGEPIKVALIQPNIPQDLKWDTARLQDWLARNLELVRQHPAPLTSLPETTLPLFERQLPPGYLEALSAPARALGGDVITGTFTQDDAGNIYNSAVAIGTQGRQVFSKNHLLPFGEFVPGFMRWLLDLVNIPMADQTPGGPRQANFNIAGQKVAINICYEDVFGEELIHALPEATLMLNLSNLAWYGNSHAQPQHLQIARYRAMEAGRPMLRSTNTGMTAIVLPDGSVPHVLPPFTTGAIEAEVRGYGGLTPYARWGNWPVLVTLATVFGMALWRQRRKRRPGAGASRNPGST